jgi:transcriptional regulator with XRE-family HTH domain
LFNANPPSKFGMRHSSIVEKLSDLRNVYKFVSILYSGHMSTINLQQSIPKRQAPIYNVGVSTFDPVRFAAWLGRAYENSRFKSHAALGSAADLSRSTVSGYISAKPNSGGRPSQPEAETVIRLAKALNVDVNEALLAAGWAPLNRTDDFEEVDLGNVRVSMKRGDFTEADKEEFLEELKFRLDRLRRKKEPERNSRETLADILDND